MEARYEAKVEEHWKSDDKSKSLGEIYEEECKLYLEIEEARKPDHEIREQRRILINHNLLSGFLQKQNIAIRQSLSRPIISSRKKDSVTTRSESLMA